MRYHGGKWRLAPYIISHFPIHNVYTEAFGGAGSVLLRKERSYGEIYNDLDGQVVNLFRVMRDRGEELMRLIELTPFARDEFIESYSTSDDDVEQARRTIYRSFSGFGSAAGSGYKTGFRSCSNRSSTTPTHDWRNYPMGIPALIERLRGVTIENKDAGSLLVQHDSISTLHYVDPPYVHITRDKTKKVKNAYNFEMQDSDHVELLRVLISLKGMVIVSGYDNEIYTSILHGWLKIKRDALADGARKRTEILYISPNCELG